MTATTPATAPPATLATTGAGWRHRLESVPVERVRGLAIAATLVLAGTILHAVNLAGAPQRLAGEGDLVSRVWAVDNLRTLGTATYLYDRPPHGWIQLGAWTQLTGAFDRAPTGIAAVREAMVVAQALSAGLLWVLARRLGLARWAAAVALVLFGLSPLALHAHRQVLLENLAVTWALAALVLASGARSRPGTAAAAGACLGVAVLTSETALLLVPVLAFQLWRATPPDRRRVALATAGSVFLVVSGSFVAVSASRGELLPAGGQPSLIDGAWHRLLAWPATGAGLGPGSLGPDGSGWLRLDPVGPALALAAAPLALVAVRRLAPVAVGFLVTMAAVVAAGQVPPGLVAVALPLGALLVGGAASHAWTAGRDRASAARAGDGAAARAGDGASTGRHDPGTGTAPEPARCARRAGAAVAVVAVAAAWAGESRALLARDPEAPMRAATAWIAGNVADDERLIVDDALWVDLVEGGTDPGRLTSYGALAADPDLGAEPPLPWRDHDIVVATAGLPGVTGARAELDAAVRASVPEATFGSGPDRVEIRRIVAHRPG